MRRILGVDEAFESEPWQKYTKDTAADFMSEADFQACSDPGKDFKNVKVFKMMDVNGVEKINLKDALRMGAYFKPCVGLE